MEHHCEFLGSLGFDAACFFPNIYTLIKFIETDIKLQDNTTRSKEIETSPVAFTMNIETYR